MSRIEQAEHDRSVGDRRLRSAAPVADRAGRRPRAFGTDLEQPELIDMRDAAAAGADGHDVRHHHVQRQAVDAEFGSALHRRLRLAAGNQADVTAGATDIDGDDVEYALALRHFRCRGYCRRGAGDEHIRRPPPGGVERYDTAVRLHDQRCSGDSEIQGPRSETF